MMKQSNEESQKNKQEQFCQKAAQSAGYMLMAPFVAGYIISNCVLQMGHNMNIWNWPDK